MDYSRTERRIASFFRKFPAIKETVKFVYQRINYLVNKKDYTVKSDYKIEKVDYDGHETFFGYYDKSPLNEKETKLLFQASQLKTRDLPDPNKPISVVLQDFKTKEILFESKSKTYNWQQGCKLQWIDDEKFIYNSYNDDKNQLISTIVNTTTYSTREICLPTYDSTNEYSLSLNYKRLEKLRPDYGYRNLDSRFINLEDSEDGIFKVVHNNPDSYELLLSLERIKSVNTQKTMSNALHKVNHIMISPNGKCFMFLHRWFNKGIKNDRLMICDSDGSNLKEILAQGMVSHCFWKDDENIISYAATKKEGDLYYNINILDNQVKKIEFKGYKTCGDGHPNINNQINMIFDTYPNRSRIKTLYLLNMLTKKKIEIAQFYESFKFKGETRCDLHPRWSPKGKYIFVDSVHESNSRGLFFLKLN